MNNIRVPHNFEGIEEIDELTKIICGWITRVYSELDIFERLGGVIRRNAVLLCRAVGVSVGFIMGPHRVRMTRLSPATAICIY